MSADCDFALIQLSRGVATVVDRADYEWLSQFKWHARISTNKKNFYAARWEFTGSRRRLVLMHRLILDAPAEMQVDHRDRDPLNNRRSNLRLATASQNQINTVRKPCAAGYRGVVFDGNRVRARIRVSGRQIWLGSFDAVEDAARAHDEAAIRYQGEFAILNFPRSGPAAGEV